MKKALILLLSIFFVFACSDKPIDLSKIAVPPGFSDYVNAFTTGVVSNNDPIKIILIEASSKAVVGEELKEEVFSFEPAIEGKAVWVDEQTIEFRPDNRLPSGQKFISAFDLGKVLDVPEEFQEMEFGFMVFHQNIFTDFEGIKTIDDTDYSKQEVFGVVRTGDYTLPAELEACFTAEQNGNPLKIKWEHNQNNHTHDYTLNNVKRGNKESFVRLKWQGDPIGVDIEDELEIRIPPLGEFSVVKVSVVNEPGLHFSIQCSDPVDAKQNLEGLIYLESGKDLKLTVDNNEIKAYPKGKMDLNETVVVHQAVINTKGQQLQNEYRRRLEFNLEKPSIQLIGDGVIMPSNGALNFPFKAINLKAVNLRILRVYENNINQFFQGNNFNGSSNLARVGRLVYDGTVDLVAAKAIDYGVWNNFKIDINKYVDSEPGAIYRVMMSFERYQSLYPCGDSTGVVKPMRRQNQNYESSQYYMDVDDWFAGGMDYNEKDNPCSDSYYKYYTRQVSRNVMASNFGIIAKEGADNNYHISVSDLRTTDPISGITIEAYNYQNQLIASGDTDGDGHVELNPEGKAYLIIAKKGKQRGYLRVDDGSALSMSLYEVGGSKIEKGIKGFLYGERGVWRPGDSLFLSFVLEDKLKSLPSSHPVIVELYNPLGKLYARKVSSKGVKGMYAFTFTTQPNDPTGKWRAKAIVGNSEFSKSLKIETVKPNRIRMDFDLPEIISIQSDITTKLKADWLYGSPAANLKTRVELNVLNMKTEFKSYEGYQFDDRSKRFSTDEVLIAEGKTNSEGESKISFDWENPIDAPGMLKLRFSSKVFEQGGDFSQDFLSKKYSPYTSYVGVKMDGGSNWRTALNTENTHPISIAAVDENGKALSKNVKVELYKVSYNWWWEGNGEDELTNYVRRKSSDLLQTDYFNVKNGKSTYTLKFPDRGWGKYLIRVIDQVSGHSSMQTFYANYSGWYTDADGNTEAASMLNLEADKEAYKVGETAKINLPSGGIGRVFVTIEKGDKILKSFWKDAGDNATVLEIETTPEMAPNVYVSATLIQPHGQEENALPIRMYGVVPISVSDPNTYLYPEISCPNDVQPQSSFKVKVKEKEGRKMAYTLAVVDEGLLSLTRFKTPNPWPAFYTKEALSVKTWDMYKYVMSAQSGKMAALLAVGGDEALIYKEDAEANRFKPVVQYLGPFYLESGKEANHTIKLPNYIGAVRVMVVAAHEGAYGNAEKEIQVKKPLMVQSTLPRVLGPSEKIKIPVNVIAMSNSIKKVNVKVSTNDLLKSQGEESRVVNFTEKGDKTIYFDYDVARALGVAKFKVEVSAGNEKAFEEIEVLVRPSNPEITDAKIDMVKGNSTWSETYTSIGIQGTNKAVLEVSRIPDLNLEKQLSYLIRYPHGCIEQTTSAVFPQLYLENFVSLSKAEKAEVQKNINAALNKYKSFQTLEGGFAYWPTSSGTASEWGTNYAGHFMVEAKNKGYELPSGVFNDWVKFQKKVAMSWNRRNYSFWGRYEGDLAQAYRLYTLALCGEEEIGAMNRLKNDVKLSSAGAYRLAAAYAVIGQESAAKSLTNKPFSIPSYRSMGYSYGSDLRDRAMVLETMVYLKQDTKAATLVQEIARDLSKGWHSTQTRAYALLAIAKMMGGKDGQESLNCELIVNGKRIEVGTQLPMYRYTIDVNKNKSGLVEVINKGNSTLFVQLVQSGIPVEMNNTYKREDLRMSVVYKDLKGKSIDVSKLKQGTDFKAIITLTHPGVRGDYKEVALNQIFPSGWQIINSRLADDYTTNPDIEYQDIRDDRVYSYFDLNKRESITVEVLLNATFLGRYYKPGIFCAPMYDESIKAVEPGAWIEVVKE